VTDLKQRVLVVDDCKKTIQLIKKELAGKGFEVHTATSVDQATRMILKDDTRPDVVLLKEALAELLRQQQESK
jgi:DNA-binding response OmpR family regulator